MTLERGQDVDEGSGHGRQRVAGKQKPAEQALQANKSLLNKAPQATQPADSPSGSGLEETNGHR